MQLVETCLEDDRWDALGLEDLAEAAACAVLAHLDLPATGFVISLLGCDDARMAELNGSFRDKPRPTNVLSWPSEERAAEQPGDSPEPPLPGSPDMPQELGDIAIGYEICQAEAQAANCPVKSHLSHLLVHGVLHLLGYDHIDDQDATLMMGLEVEILAKMGISDPYTDVG